MATLRHIHLFIAAFVLFLKQNLANELEHPPRFVQMPPQNAIIRLDRATKLDCIVDANPPARYQWFKNHHPFNPGSNDGRYTQWPKVGTLIIARPGQDDDGMYQCTATNKFGTAVSNMINVRRAEIKPIRSRTLIIRSVSVGGSIVLPCQVPTSYPQAIVTWVFQALGSNNIVTVKETARRAVTLGGALVISMVVKEDNGFFWCAARNPFLITTTNGRPVRLKVMPGPLKLHNVKVLHRSPASNYALMNSTIQLKCILIGNPVPKYRWSKLDKGKTFVQPPRYAKMVNGGTVLKIQVTSIEAGGTYRCLGLNELSTESAVVDYNIRVDSKPVFKIAPRNVAVPENSSHIFQCEAMGSPTPKVVWTINGKDPSHYLDGLRRRMELNSIILKRLTPSDSAIFQCNASNIHGYTFINAYLHVLSNGRPTFVSKPSKNILVSVGQSVVIPCQTYAAPKADVIWRKDGHRINVARYARLDNGNLKIKIVESVDYGVYECIARNRFGKVSAQGYLQVRQRTRIILAPMSVRTYEYSSVKFICTGETDPLEKLTTAWYKDGSFLDFRYTKGMQMNSQDNSLILIGVRPRDSGIYSCNVSNGLDFDVASASLFVMGRPDPPYRLSLHCSDKIKEKMATLSWNPGSSNNSPVMHYVIEFSIVRQYSTSKEWMPAEVIGGSERFIGHTTTDVNSCQIKLRPNVIHKFRVRTRNYLGLSDPSEEVVADETCQLPAERPHTNPSTLTVYATLSDKLVIQWTPMPYIEHNGNHLGYHLSIACPQCQNPLENCLLEVTNGQQGQLSFINEINCIEEVHEIETNTLYHVTIQARNSKGLSLAAPREARGYSRGSHPEFQLQDLKLIENHADGITLQWNSLPPREFIRVHGEFVGYRVEWCDVDIDEMNCHMAGGYKDFVVKRTNNVNKILLRSRRSRKFMNWSFPHAMFQRDQENQLNFTTQLSRARVVLRERRDVMSSETQRVTITDFPGGKQLRVMVRLLNSLYAGVASDPLIIETVATNPGAVEQLRRINIGIGHADVAWDTPSITNGGLTGYEIAYQQVTDLRLGPLTVACAIDDPSILQYTVTGLKSDTEYRIYVWSVNNQLRSMESFIQVRTSKLRAPSPPSFTVILIDSTQVNISYEPSHQGIPGSIFWAQYRQRGESIWLKSVVDFRRRWIHIPSLLADEWYEICMIAANSDHLMASSAIHMLKTDGYRFPRRSFLFIFNVISLGCIVVPSGCVFTFVICHKKREKKLFGWTKQKNSFAPLKETKENNGSSICEGSHQDAVERDSSSCQLISPLSTDPEDVHTTTNIITSVFHHSDRVTNNESNGVLIVRNSSNSRESPFRHPRYRFSVVSIIGTATEI